MTMSDQRRQIRSAPNGFNFFVDNPTRGVDVLMPRGQHGRGCQTRPKGGRRRCRGAWSARFGWIWSTAWSSTAAPDVSPRTPPCTLRAKGYRRVALKIYGNDVAAELETLIE